jgi:hypothetical protein
MKWLMADGAASHDRSEFEELDVALSAKADIS